MVQEPLFIFKTTAIPGQITVLADDAVTGYNDGNRILTIGETHCADGLDVAHADGDGFVRCGFAIRNFEQGIPYLFLKFRPLRIYLHGKEFSAPVKVFIELLDTLSGSLGG